MSDERSRTSPIYSLGEVAHFASTTPDTVRRWLYGYDTSHGQQAPMLGRDHGGELVSFLELVEIYMALAFRARGITVGKIRAAHQKAIARFGVTYPFARLDLGEWALQIVAMMESDDGMPRMAERLSDGQTLLPGFAQAIVRHVNDRMNTVECDDDLAMRLFPRGKNIPIVIDPTRASGVPTILGRNVTVSGIQARFQAGQPILFIARDLDISPQQVEAAVQFQYKPAA